jgi:hypothetical protein
MSHWPFPVQQTGVTLKSEGELVKVEFSASLTLKDNEVIVLDFVNQTARIAVRGPDDTSDE